jgi:hypothetical protein
MSGVIPSLPVRVFMAWEGIIYNYRPCMNDLKTSSSPKRNTDAHFLNGNISIPMPLGLGHPS